MNDPRAWAGYFLIVGFVVVLLIAVAVVAGALVLVLPLFAQLVAAVR